MDIDIFFGYELSGAQFLMAAHELENSLFPDYRKARYDGEYYDINKNLFLEDGIMYFNTINLIAPGEANIQEVSLNNKRIHFQTWGEANEESLKEVSGKIESICSLPYSKDSITIAVVSISMPIDGTLKYGQLIPLDYKETASFKISSTASTTTDVRIENSPVVRCSVTSNFIAEKGSRFAEPYSYVYTKTTVRNEAIEIGGSLIYEGFITATNVHSLLDLCLKNTCSLIPKLTVEK